MKEFLGWVAIGFIALASILAIGLGTSWFGLVSSRPMNKYAEQTRHEVFQTSAAREEGINKSILSECLSMRSAQDLSSKHALAQFIIADAGMYEGHLTREAQYCVSEAQGVPTP